MTADPSLPPARARYRHGLRPFLPDPALDAEEALIDRLDIVLDGSLQATSPDALRYYAELLNSSPAARGVARPRVFGRGRWQGNRFSLDVVKGTSVGSFGWFHLYQARGRGSGARIKLHLRLNPMRTLGHILDRFRSADLEALSPAEFFCLAEAPTASAKSLDRNDNMVTSFLRLGGTVDRERINGNSRYLRAYEQALRGLLLEELCPTEQEFTYSDDHGVLVARSPDYVLRLDWPSLAVTQCEVCWERAAPSPVATVAKLADAVLAAARQAAAQTHPILAQAGVERIGGAVSINVPLTPKGDTVLSVYAKRADEEPRIRLEVRYKDNIPQTVRDCLDERSSRLLAWLDALRSNAVPRVPWAELHQLLAERPPLDVGSVIELVDAVTAATRGTDEQRRYIVEALLTTGGVTATGTDGLAPQSVLKALARGGHVEHIRLVGKDGIVGRRYALRKQRARLIQ